MSATVLLAVADLPTRVGLRAALSRDGFAIVAEPADAGAAVAAAVDHRPDVALVATSLPGGALEATAAIAAARPGVRIVVLTERATGDGLVAAVLAGAVGYLDLDIDPSRLPRVIEGVLAGEVALPRSHSEHILAALRARDGRRVAVSARASAPLSDREWEVLELLADGASTAVMASRLRISEVTVRRHVSAIVSKLGVPDRAAAAALARERSAA